MSAQGLPIAIIGMGGYAGEHHRVVQMLEQEGLCRLVATCDPEPARFTSEREQWEFAQRGVAVYADYREMLDAHAHELVAVTIPTPVPLHAPMHQACLEHGLACYLEKPPTLYYPEFEEMLARDQQAPKQTQVGFNFIVEESRQALKQRLLQGEFGQVQRVSFLGLWPRTSRYFGRSYWAGRLFADDGRPILDSCIGNAMAHYLHNLHFWAGQAALFDWAEVAQAQAELYRAHPIQNFDTIFLQGVCPNGIEIRVAASHACAGGQEQEERVECERATLCYVTGRDCRITWKEGREETLPVDSWNRLAPANFKAWFAYLRGEAKRPLTRLQDAKPFVHFYGLAYVSAGTIHTVPETVLERGTASDGGATVAIAGLRDLCLTFLTAGRFPSEQGVAWAQPGHLVTASHIAELPAILHAERKGG